MKYFDQQALVKRHKRIVVLVSILVFSSYAFGQPNSDSIRTRAGVLRVERQMENETATLLLNEKPITKETLWQYIYIDQVFSFPEHDVVLISGDNGGTRPVNEYAFVIIRESAQPKFLTNNEFYSDDGTFKANQSGSVIEIDLGYSQKYQKIARLEGEQFTIVKQRPANVGSLSTRDCNTLYDMLDTCARTEQNQKAELCQSDPTDIENWGYSMWSKPSEIAFEAISNHPAFDENNFVELCRKVCLTGKVPPVETFRETVCKSN